MYVSSFQVLTYFRKMMEYPLKRKTHSMLVMLLDDQLMQRERRKIIPWQIDC